MFGKKKRAEAAKAAVTKARKSIKEAVQAGENPAGAEAELKKAQTLLAAGKYDEGEARATRAERLAESLLDNAPRVRKSIQAMERAKDEMDAYGLPSDDVGPEIARVRELITRGFVKVKGKTMPGPERAARRAKVAARRFTGRIQSYEEAARAVATARSTLDQSVTEFPHLSADELRNGPWTGAYEALAQAESQLDGANFSEARDLANWAVALCRQTQDRYAAALDEFEKAEKNLERLKKENVPSEALENVLVSARQALARGELDSVAEQVGRARQGAHSIQEAHASAALAVAQAEEALAQAREWGFSPQEAETKLSEAKAQIEAGEFLEAGQSAAGAKALAESQRSTHRAAGERIQAIRAETRAAGIERADAGQIEDLLAQAEKALEEGDYKGCSEQIELAVFLLQGAKQKRSGTQEIQL